MTSHTVAGGHRNLLWSKTKIQGAFPCWGNLSPPSAVPRAWKFRSMSNGNVEMFSRKSQHIPQDSKRKELQGADWKHVFHISCPYELLSGDPPYGFAMLAVQTPPIEALYTTGTSLDHFFFDRVAKINRQQSCGYWLRYSGYNAMMWVFWLQRPFARFLLTDCDLSWSWGMDMPFLPLPKMQRAGIGSGRFTMWGGFAIGKCRSVPRIPNSWCQLALFFGNELSPLFKSHMTRCFDCAWPMRARHNKKANERRA